jgi:hypothetical protein
MFRFEHYIHEFVENLKFAYLEYMLRIVTMKYPCKISFEHYIHESVMYTGRIFLSKKSIDL